MDADKNLLIDEQHGIKVVSVGEKSYMEYIHLSLTTSWQWNHFHLFLDRFGAIHIDQWQSQNLSLSINRQIKNCHHRSVKHRARHCTLNYPKHSYSSNSSSIESRVRKNRTIRNVTKGSEECLLSVSQTGIKARKAMVWVRFGACIQRVCSFA